MKIVGLKMNNQTIILENRKISFLYFSCFVKPIYECQYLNLSHVINLDEQHIFFAMCSMRNTCVIDKQSI